MRAKLQARLLFSGVVLILGGLGLPGSRIWAADNPKPIDFNRDILPVLSDNCFVCHGPDANKRDAELRLDIPEGIFEDRGGYQPVTPGKSSVSELFLRVSSANDFEAMPPASSHRKLTPNQIELIKRWIDEGAPYKKHWAFVAPRRPELPMVQEKSWVRNPIDHFVLARLEREGLKPSPEAQKQTLLRRVSFDLTGLPPTPAEMQAFLADHAPDAYEKQVDRLLASPRYGENMARVWLDLARYADSTGFGEDDLLSAWPWRDWVIRAYNQNMPYDQFTVRQIAGDLLPDATLDDRIATGFNRNNATRYKGDGNDEENRTENVVDRVNALGTTWLGLTVGCARCHDHKYDPIKQKDFYGLFGFYNDLVEGDPTPSGNPTPVVSLPSPAQKQHSEALRREIAAVLAILPERSEVEQENAWRQTALQVPTQPGEAGLLAHYGFEGNLTDGSGHQPDARLRGVARYMDGVVGQGLRLVPGTDLDFGQLGNMGRSQPFSIALWVSSAGRAERAVFQKHEAGQNWRGYELSLEDPERASDHLTHFRVVVRLASSWPESQIEVRSKTRCITSLSATDVEAMATNARHLVLSYDGSGKADGVALYLNGELLQIEVAKDTLAGDFRTSAPLTIAADTLGRTFNGLIDDFRVYNRTLSAEESQDLAVHLPTRSLLVALSGKPTTQIESLQAEKSPGIEAEQSADQAEEDQTKQATESDEDKFPALQQRLSDQFLRFYAPEEQRTAYRRLQELRAEQTLLESSIPTAMVMAGMKKPRATHVLGRGVFDNPKDEVTAGVPAFLLPLPKDAARNRLTLARWLIDPENPLTARVEVNRYWQTYFGIGLVKTAEDFGSQGEPPSHPELLDWLATEFIRTGWDIKAMQRLIVTSATYRQSSRITAALRERDPQNRLLARGPRVRLAAEQIRDNALAVSGLLRDKIGGPSVYPYSPPGIWQNDYGEDDYTQQTGESLYRRSLYIVWKRTVSPASLSAFDVPTRERCSARRINTNTPLQALALLNDPTYVEASRVLAQQVIFGHDRNPDRRVVSAFRRVMQRDPQTQERVVLTREAQRLLTQFRRNPQAAVGLLSIGDSKPDPSLDPAELAAWTMVTRTILNLNEAITKD